MKTVNVAATMVAALLVVGRCVMAQEQEPTSKRSTGASPSGISSAPADEAEDESDEVEAASFETQEYDYGSHPGYYEPRGPAKGFVGGYTQTNPFDAV
ncbi:MAG TPA: hypothetical protein VGX76_07130, partial [Pirellulales bacterium]|nr:hypothetical protein [Pirellulales bacterium]